MLPTQRLLGPVLVMATLVASIVSAFGAPLIPSIARELAVPLSSAQWSLTVALLAGAVSSPVLGRLGDGRHRRATMIGALGVVTIGGTGGTGGLARTPARGEGAAGRGLRSRAARHGDGA